MRRSNEKCKVFAVVITIGYLVFFGIKSACWNQKFRHLENWRNAEPDWKGSSYNAGRGITSQALLYQHMSNHYRRILNAKKSIDTAPPTTFKTKHNSASSLVRNYSSISRKFNGGNISPALTDSTASAYSNGGSYYRSDAYYGRQCQNSRNNECNCGAGLEINPSSSEMELINQIAFDTKRGPANCFDAGWKNVERRTNFSEFRSPYEGKKIGNRSNNSEISKKGSGIKCKLSAVKRKLPVKDKPPSDLMEKHSKCFVSHNNSFCPRILKTNATSKVKNMKVYHPPRKKRGASQWKEEEEETKTSMKPVITKSKCSVMSSSCQKKKSVNDCKCKQPEASQTSSRDSAYNGGVSSLPESRSPTPDQRTQKNCCCHRKERDTYYDNVRTSDENIIVPNLKLTDNQDTQTEINVTCERKPSKEDSRSTDYRELISRSKQLNFEDENAAMKNYVCNDDEKDSIKRKLKEEALYTNFIRDITAEVLEKGLYTNKSLKKVMKRHMISNLWVLDKDRMLKEIDKLRIQLGIPQDEDLLDVNLNGTESAGNIDECYTVISDSELIEPTIFHRLTGSKPKRNGHVTEDASRKRSENSGSDVEKRFPKSISEVLSQSRENNELTLDTESDEEDEELISVIHVSKLIKEKKKRDSFVRDPSSNATQGNSADESEQSSDHVSRKKKPHTRYRKPEKTSSSSDDLETNQRVLDGRRNYAGKTEKATAPEKGEKVVISESSDKEDIESLIE